MIKYQWAQVLWLWWVATVYWHFKATITILQVASYRSLSYLLWIRHNLQQTTNQSRFYSRKTLQTHYTHSTSSSPDITTSHCLTSAVPKFSAFLASLATTSSRPSARAVTTPSFVTVTRDVSRDDQMYSPLPPSTDNLDNRMVTKSDSKQGYWNWRLKIPNRNLT